MKKIKLNNNGDTIIEVLIVLAVLGLALGISYATANRSLLNTRQGLENSIAENLTKSQVENIRSFSGRDPSSPQYIYQSSLNGIYFCIFNGQIVKFNPGFNLYSGISNYPSNCVQDNRYGMSVQWDGGTNNNFTVRTIWDDVLGHGTDSVTLEYRIQPTNDN